MESLLQPIRSGTFLWERCREKQHYEEETKQQNKKVNKKFFETLNCAANKWALKRELNRKDIFNTSDKQIIAEYPEHT